MLLVRSVCCGCANIAVAFVEVVFVASLWRLLLRVELLMQLSVVSVVRALVGRQRTVKAAAAAEKEIHNRVRFAALSLSLSLQPASCCFGMLLLSLLKLLQTRSMARVVWPPTRLWRSVFFLRCVAAAPS